jgi:predicted homoserine dehydrogenase-like protein
MNLHRMLQQRAAANRPVTVAIIGAGKFGSMFITQVRTTIGMHLVGVADLAPDRARERMKVCGWDESRFSAGSVADALKNGSTLITDDALSLIRHESIEVIIEATGDPTTGIRLCLAAI